MGKFIIVLKESNTVLSRSLVVVWLILGSIVERGTSDLTGHWT